MRNSRFIAILGIAALLFGWGPVGAQEPVYSTEGAPPAGYIMLTPPELEELVAPIALYPDPLLGIVLPASSHPVQIVQAARFLNANPGAVEPPQGSNWESSVIALLRYADVLAMLDENIEWTSRLGDAVYYQMEDVMAAVQEVRRKAEQAGNLTDTEHQVIVREREIIRIEPADPEIVYVPVYDPQVIYVPTPVAVPFITYRVGYHYGPWLPYTCDWYSYGLSINFFYYGGHWHRHHGRHHWKPSHRSHGRHHGHHDWDDDRRRGDWDDDRRRGDWDGRRGGNWDKPSGSDLKTPLKDPSQTIQRKVPAGEGYGNTAKTPTGGANIPRDLKTPSQSRSNASNLKTPRTVNRSDWYPRNFQSPSIERSSNRSTVKIPSHSSSVQSNRRSSTPRNVYRGSNSGIAQQKVPIQQNFSARSIGRSSSDRKAPVQNFSAPKVPSRNFTAPKAPVQSFKAPKAPAQSFSAPKSPASSFKAPRGDGGSRGGGGRGAALGGGGGKRPK